MESGQWNIVVTEILIVAIKRKKIWLKYDNKILVINYSRIAKSFALYFCLQRYYIYPDRNYIKSTAKYITS